MVIYDRLRNAANTLIENYFGEEVTLRSRVMTRNAQDDPSWTNTDTTVKAAVIIAGINESIESAGVIRVGDGTFHLRALDTDGDAINPSDGNLIYHQGIWYRIRSVSPGWSEGERLFSLCQSSPLEKNSSPAAP